MILITGATGTIGRPLIASLLADGARVRAVTRDPQVANLPPQVDVVHGDPSRPETLEGAFDGVSAVFVNPRAVRDAAAELLALARSHGVHRVVVLSATNVDDDFALQPSRFRGDRNKEVEDAVIGSGLDWVSVRSSTMAPNSIGLFGGQIRSGDVVYGPYPTAAEALIDPVDVAAVAASALRHNDLDRRCIDLTGPQSLTQQEMVAVIGKVMDRTLHYQEIRPEEARATLTDLGFTPEFADANLARLAANIDKPAPTTEEVTTILKRPASTYANWVTANANAFKRTTA
jgi:uncharacterized protein YbjT (DUF2867 family)